MPLVSASEQTNTPCETPHSYTGNRKRVYSAGRTGHHSGAVLLPRGVEAAILSPVHRFFTGQLSVLPLTTPETSMHIADDHTARRSVIGSLLATVAAAGASLFGVAHARQDQTAAPRSDASDAQAANQPPLFSGSVTHGGLVYVAGKGEHGAGDIKVHTTSVLDQIEAELKKAGSSMDKVVKVNVYLHDIRDYDGMNEAYRGRFGARPPVRTTVSCPGGIPGRSLVEIDCIAAL